MQLAAAEVDERSLDVLLDRAKARAIGTSTEKSVTARKASAGEDSGVQEAQEVRDEAHAYRKMVEALHQNIDRNTFLLSREITRRVGRDPRSSRAEKMSA